MVERRVRELAATDIGFDEDEELTNSYLLGVMERIMHDWELNCNSGELVHAVHTIQMFIIKHMLQRLGAKDFSDWYGSEEVTENAND